MIAKTACVVPAPRHTVRHLARWAAEDCTRGAAVLNIGAGADQCGVLDPLLVCSPHLVGVDPDEAVLRNLSLDERHQMPLEEFATTAVERFDLALAVYVLEHVEDPAGFVAAVGTVLKPTGTFLGLTPNLTHYFGASTWALARLRCSDRVLVRLKPGVDVLEHHFPPQYRLNTIDTITRHLQGAGFRSVQFRCYDATNRYRWYLPGGLKWFSPAYTRLAYTVGDPRWMGHLAFRASR